MWHRKEVGKTQVGQNIGGKVTKRDDLLILVWLNPGSQEVLHHILNICWCMDDVRNHILPIPRVLLCGMHPGRHSLIGITRTIFGYTFNSVLQSLFVFTVSIFTPTGWALSNYKYIITDGM